MTSRVHRSVEIHTTYPLIFWRQCHGCKREFVRETLWHWLDERGKFVHHLYACGGCAPTEADALRIATYRPPRPPPPPLPPQPKAGA